MCRFAAPTRPQPAGRRRLLPFPAVSNPLTRADVDRIARLAHLELTEREAEQFTRQLGDILAYFERLNRIDTAGVAATTHPVTSAPVMRDDEPRPSLPVDDAFGNAPDRGGERLFRVPKVIG